MAGSAGLPKPEAPTERRPPRVEKRLPECPSIASIDTETNDDSSFKAKHRLAGVAGLGKVPECRFTGL